MMHKWAHFFFLLALAFTNLNLSRAQDNGYAPLELDEENDLKMLEEGNKDNLYLKQSEKLDEVEISELEEADDLEALKGDIGPLYFEKAPLNQQQKEELIEKKREMLDEVKELKDEKSLYQEITEQGAKDARNTPSVNDPEDLIKISKGEIFDVGKDEAELLEVAKTLQKKIPASEWNELALKAKVEKYTIQRDDYLWKIAKELFGSGFFYPKIWAINNYITNPHQVEPGMILTFTTGDDLTPPEARLGAFDQATPGEGGEGSVASNGSESGGGEATMTKRGLKEFGDDVVPDWIKEKQDLIKQGVYIQNASEFTYEDLEKLNAPLLNREFERYAPPRKIIQIDEPVAEDFKDEGFDKKNKLKLNYKEGFYLNTFLSTNLVQDFGYVNHAQKEGINVHNYDRIYINFDSGMRIVPGDEFSIYFPEGEVEHEISDRKGFKYTIIGHFRVVEKKGHLWEVEVFDVSGEIKRGDRVTVYTPKIEKVTKTFNPRNIEAAVIGGHDKNQIYFSFGNVIYLDRGRADGVELGNIFEAYSFHDRGTEKQITADPAYKLGEVTVISLTDNFATALVSQSKNEFGLGTIMLSKTIEAAAREARLKNKDLTKKIDEIERKGLEELDTELKLEDINDDILEQADKIQMTEDELDELERQEREKSILTGQEKDLESLEKLEKELESAQSQLNESKLDDDKLLERQDLNGLEGEMGKQHPDAFADLNEIESEMGQKYLDEELTDKVNPYGLSDNDLEEIDELLNLDPEEYERMRKEIQEMKKKREDNVR